jgi:hypothetical protein
MGELISIREILRDRAIADGRARDRHSLHRAVEILKQNLEAVSHEIVEAPAAAQPELLERAERLVAMIRYGMQMLGDGPHDELLVRRR